MQPFKTRKLFYEPFVITAHSESFVYVMEVLHLSYNKQTIQYFFIYSHLLTNQMRGCPLYYLQSIYANSCNFDIRFSTVRRVAECYIVAYAAYILKLLSIYNVLYITGHFGLGGSGERITNVLVNDVEN